MGFSGVILENEGSIRRRYKKALFLYKDYKRSPQILAIPICIVYLHCF